jgi:hypothetical protein
VKQKFLALIKVKIIEEFVTVVTRWLITQDMDLYKERKENLVPRCDKFRHFGGNYVESTGQQYG